MSRSEGTGQGESEEHRRHTGRGVRQRAALRVGRGTRAEVVCELLVGITRQVGDEVDGDAETLLRRTQASGGTSMRSQ